MERRSFLFIIVGLAITFAAAGIVIGCSGSSDAEAKQETAADVQTSATLWMNPLAILVPGENPLWFELADTGAVLISSPEEASLNSFLPWPYSVYIKDMLIQENRLVMAVNQLGFLVIIPWDDTRLGIYSVFDKTYWSRYSSASLFLFDNTPSVLLYRDDFFSDEEASPLPESPVMGLVKGSVQPVKTEIPAFRDFPASEGWDIESLDRGKNGEWYFSAVQKSSAMHKKIYYRTESLDDQPVSISMGDYWLAMEPSSWGNASLLLQDTVKASLGGKPENGSYLIEEIAPDSVYKTRYGYKSGEAESDMMSLFAYTGDDEVLAVFPDGSGAIGKQTADDTVETYAYNLPKLPENFVYTGIVLIDNTVLASWEEQQAYGVGAAGFVLVKGPFKP